MLRVFLFGAPRIELNGQAVLLRRSKVLALLAYLATTRQPHDREALLALLWPEFDAASARNNLRRELSLLKTLLGEEVLVADRLQIAWNPQVDSWLDITAFQTQLAVWRQHRHSADALCAECAAALETAAQLYRDDFLAGFGLSDSSAFDEWQFFVCEGLRQQLAQALQALSSWYSRTGAYGAAIDSTRRRLALDPLHEVAQRELMRLYAWTGQHSAALRQYEECARLLEAELGAEPELETTELYAAIKARRLVSPATIAEPALIVAATVTIPASEPASPARQHQVALHNLPPLGGFIGRQRELADLIRRLTDPDCHLLTVVGSGGIGKTRLVLRAAQILAEEWSGADDLADGVLFVPLAAVETTSGLVAALAAAARFEFYSNVPPDQQVLDFFRTRRMLVILDNFEQLLDAVTFVAELLAAAPDLRLLVTSRVALNLRDEWFHPIEGLSFPAEGDDTASVAQLARYDAVRLFEQHARRVRSDFSLSRERAQVVHLCQLVEGMPLALELAAAWLKVLSVEQVVAALERGLDILTARDRNIPARHRSMRAVLEQSWRLLLAEERQTLAGLSVFRGGFSAEAAAQIVGATLPVLAALVDKSLLRMEGPGRYGIHELLRQYGDEQLRRMPEALARIRQAHSVYYLRFLAQRADAMAHSRQREATAEIATEFENIRLAWQQAVESIDVEGIHNAVSPFGNVCLYRGFYQEGIAALKQAIHSLQSIDPTPIRDAALAYTLNDLAWLYIRVDQMAAAQAALAESHQLYERLHEPPPPGRASDPLAGLAHLTMIEGKYAEAVQIAEEFLRRSEARGYIPSVSFACYVLTHSALALGENAKARHAAEQAYAAAQAAQDRWFMGYVLNELGHVALAEGQYPEARQHYQASYAIREEFNDSEGMGLALILQGKVALLQQEYAAARALYQRGLAIFPNRGDRGSIASARHGLGMIAYAEADYRTAAQFFHDALGLARGIQLVPLMLAILTSASELLMQAGRLDQARELLMLVLRHPATEHETGARARQLLVQHEHELVPCMDDAVVQRDVAAELDAVVSRLLIELEGSQVLLQ